MSSQTMRQILLGCLLAIAGAFSVSAQGAKGAIYTTNQSGTAVNTNTYASSTDVYISGGPQNHNPPGLIDGTYFFQVTDPSGKTLLSTDPVNCRQLVVSGGRVSGATGPCPHTNGAFNPANGATPVQLAPFSATPNAGGEYKVWLSQSASFGNSGSKTDNFKVQQVVVQQGSCQPSSSLSVLVSGTTVVAYVPKGNWASATTGVSAVNVEGAAVVPTLIPTTNAVNSCASNPTTGQTVCTANTADVYLISGTTLGSTLSSSGSSTINFSGGICTNCGVAMDSFHDKALIGLSLAGVPGFQFLNLATSTFETAFASPSGQISEDPLIDPTRNVSGGPGALLLSAAENNTYEIVDVTISTSPAFFENPIPVSGNVFGLDSSAEDCSTGIALATIEEEDPAPTSSRVYLADLTQATFTAGAPGTWSTAASQVQTLSEAALTFGASGIAVAQGTHTGLVSGEFGGDTITAILLPATSGSGTPAVADWVTCAIGNGFSNGFDPHTLTAYKSPNSSDAIGVLTDGSAATLAVVDLTKMLNPAFVPRTGGGHGCAAGTLPGSVLSFVAVP
jgi:hypothetical protein